MTLEDLERDVSEYQEIWNMNFLNPSQFSTFARDRGMGYGRDDIVQLWQLGLLRADLIISTRKIRISGIEYQFTDDLRRHVYVDLRKVKQKSKGWADSTQRLGKIHSGTEIFFHPFRYFVLYKIDNWLRSMKVGPMQFLMSREQHGRLVKYVDDMIQTHSMTSQSSDNMNNWNDLAALATATEPCTYEQIFNTKRVPTFVDKDEYRDVQSQHFERVGKFLRELGLEKLKAYHQELCVAAEFLDANKQVHMILRLMNRDFRLRIKGELGGALHLITMAEMLRRMAEDEFKIELPEEDDSGLGFSYPDWKRRLFGANRILDGDRNIANEYLRQYGLDYGVRARVYVEGNTEFGAFESIVGTFPAVELINLGGSVAQKRGKGVAFRENLQNDLKAQIFSIIVFDGDNEENIRVVRKAVEDDEVCGGVFISSPDVEFGNFSITELEEILWNMAVENEADANSREMLKNGIRKAKNGKQLWKEAHLAVPELRQNGKDERWGRALMEYAWLNPEMVDEKKGTKKNRPLVDAVNTAVRCIHFSYAGSRSKFRIDPGSFQIVER